MRRSPPAPGFMPAPVRSDRQQLIAIIIVVVVLHVAFVGIAVGFSFLRAL